MWRGARGPNVCFPGPCLHPWPPLPGALGGAEDNNNNTARPRPEPGDPPHDTAGDFGSASLPSSQLVKAASFPAPPLQLFVHPPSCFSAGRVLVSLTNLPGTQHPPLRLASASGAPSGVFSQPPSSRALRRALGVSSCSVWCPNPFPPAPLPRLRHPSSFALGKASTPSRHLSLDSCRPLVLCFSFPSSIFCLNFEKGPSSGGDILRFPREPADGAFGRQLRTREAHPCLTSPCGARQPMVGMRPPRRFPVRAPGSASFSRSSRLIRTSTASRTLDLRLRRGHGRPQHGQAVGGASGPGCGGVPQRRSRHARQKLCSHARSTGSSKRPPHSGHVASCSRRCTSPRPSGSDASMGSQRPGAVPSATVATTFGLLRWLSASAAGCVAAPLSASHINFLTLSGALLESPLSSTSLSPPISSLRQAL